MQTFFFFGLTEALSTAASKSNNAKPSNTNADQIHLPIDFSILLIYVTFKIIIADKAAHI